MKYLVFATLLTCLSSQAALKVQEQADGSLSVLRDGVAVVTGIRPVLDADAPSERIFQTAADGSRVWNRVNREYANNFRFEVAERADGAVEISILGYKAAGALTNRTRALSFTLPGAVFNRQRYDSKIKYRLYTANNTGTLAADMKPFESRYFAAAGIVFNCDPYPVGVFSNPGTRTGVPGCWTVAPDGKGNFTASAKAMLPREGNLDAGLKIILHEGTYADYDTDHFLPSFNIYYDRFATPYVLKFGAPKAGPEYRDGNTLFEKKCGWVGVKKQAVKVGASSGAYYSHASGSGKATYRFGNLPSGYYILTCQLGNYAGTKNAFSIAVNGETLAADIAVKPREARTLARTYHVTDGKLDLVFDGDWILSGLGLQPLLSDQEDYFMRRGFWYVDGYEPSFARRNSYARPFRPATLDQTTAMPAPGDETAAKFREPPKPIELVNLSKPENAWMYELKMRNCDLGGQAMNYADPAKRAAFIADSKKQYFNAFMLHGTICRHNMADEVLARVDEQIKTFAQDAKAEGLKFIDHVDITLGWANEYGFRTLIENLDCAMLDFNVNLPTYVYCFENPKWKKRMYDYLRQQAEAGVAGFQLDELTYWRHGCGCAHCRGKFAAETGWSFPLDETNPAVKFGAKNELTQKWRDWQAGNIVNWRIGLRRHLADVNPDLYMSTYNTYGGQVGRNCSLAGFMEGARTLTMMGTEVMQEDVMRCARPMMALARIKNIFRVAYGTPSWNWFYNSNYANEVYAFAVCNMTGEVPLLTGTWLGAFYDPAFGNPVEWSVKSRPMKLDGCEPVAKVGLLFSYQSCRSNEGENHTPEILGLAQELECLHVPYEFIGDVSCTYEQLKKYDVFFLGEAQCLSDKEILALQTFLARGGRLYGRPGCGSRNELGEKRAVPLAGYDVVPSAAPFYEPEVPTYVPGQTKEFRPDPVLEKQFRQALSDRIGAAAWWKVEGAPDKFYTSVYREKGGELVLHFLNATGCNIWENGAYVWRKSKARFPELKEDIFVELPRTVAGKPVALSPEFGTEERPLEATRLADGRLRVRLPKEYAQVYTIIRFH